ncbi:DUF4115 domain-containing protein [Bombella sp. TMW 2.2559]|uniref:DUF4115 domain-containing protein n=1 Tax=Bombella dulcis TaxID=2967339 RepID=A0ABT3WAP7_9PROT|nr:RodZ domain-containing protein [Bombella dulcis]MCX5615878.1 DUF4115 domain-containing protein [Bombella dulcis]
MSEKGVVMEDKTGQSMASQPSATLGARLMARRKELGWSLGDVEAHLKVRLAILQAIEEGDYSRLPDKVYVLGFVKSYVRLLGFKDDEIMQQANRELSSYMPKRQTVQLDLPGPQEGRSTGLWVLLGIGLIVIVGAYVGWYHFSSHGQLASSILPSHLAGNSEESSSDTAQAEKSEGQEAALQKQETQKNASSSSAGTQDMTARQDDGQKDTPDLQPAPEVVSPSPTAVPSTGDVTGGDGHPAEAPVVENAQQPVQVTAPVRPADVPKAAPEPHVSQPAPAPVANQKAEDSISILAREDSWVQVTDASGKVQLVRVLKKGEVWQGVAGQTYRITSGNAGGVVFQAGNVVSAPLGLRGRVVRNATVDAASVEQGRYGYGSLAITPPVPGPADKRSQ